MRGIEKIVNQILDEGNIKKAEIENKAKVEADRILKEAELSGKEMEEEIIARVEKEVKNYEQIAILSAEQRRKREVLGAKQEWIGIVLDEAYQRIASLKDEEYLEVIKEMLIKFILPQKGEIIFSEKDLKRMPNTFMDEIKAIAEEKGGEITLSNEKRKLDNGFILVYGGIEENCTFKALFEAKKEELSDLAKEELFK